jgi:hypothetical protein
MTPSKGKPGDIGWLYGETEESTHGRQPGTLAALASGREQRTREVLAELGIPPDRAAVSLKAAKEALLKCLPDSEAKAMTRSELIDAALIPSETTAWNALSQLHAEGVIEQVKTRARGGTLRYFLKPSP